MLVSVAIAMGFSYPTIALSENPTAGFAAHPHHLWTQAKAVDDSNTKVDVEMRQIWIHGSYMNALDKTSLKRALAVQESVVGYEQSSDITPALGDELRTGTLQWGYHSPLMYWNNSEEIIDADADILKTINEQKRSSSSLNVTLRPASLFAGKRFSRYQLEAADALVITLMNQVDDAVADRWQQNMRSLTDGACEKCSLFPRDGNVTRHRVYRFSFTPLSIQEHIALTFAYSFMALYVLVSLRRMKAFHSRFGLVVTAITQMTFSILASFTICGMLKINLSQIPQNAYPFIVLVLGIENMFRLINAVLAYSPTMATELRIANALGDVGPISVAAAVQNLTILSLLSTVVSPGVAAFCAFAAIATLFDAFFLLTFFVAVLNVDIRRLELQDALANRHSHRHRRRPSPTHHTWFDALIQGRLPFSTRMAGTAVTTTFILSLNYHFFEHKEKATNLRNLLDIVRGGSTNAGEVDTFAPPPMNATLTPGEWMRMQDFDTAKEVLRLAKPGADSFVIRLFAPLIVVLGGSDRTDVSSGGEEWTHALRSFAVHHFYPVAVAIVFAVAFVAVLMNFLLYNEAGDEDNDIALEQTEEILAAQTVRLPHRLDVIKMASSENGHFVAASLDRSLSISIADRTGEAHHTFVVPPDVVRSMSWPVHHLAIDESGDWIACHCADDSILAFNHTTGSMISNLVQYPDDHPALLFAFATLPGINGGKQHFIVLTSGGRLAMSSMEDGTCMGTDISVVPLVGAALLETSKQGRQLVSVTAEGIVLSTTWDGGRWAPSNSQRFDLGEWSGKSIDQVKLRLYSDLDTELVVATTSHSVIFLSATTLAPVASFRMSETDTRIEDVLIGPSRKCSSCGQLALRYLAATTHGPGKDECQLYTWIVGNGTDACICLVQSFSTCKSFAVAQKGIHAVANAGVWNASKSQYVLGLRQQKSHVTETIVDKRRPTTSELRQRRHARQSAQSKDGPDKWEAYKLSIDGDLETLEIPPNRDADLSQDTLYVNNAGPMVSLNSQSVAVACGNTVKVIRVSRRGSISRRSAASSLERQPSTTSRHSAAWRAR